MLTKTAIIGISVGVSSAVALGLGLGLGLGLKKKEEPQPPPPPPPPPPPITGGSWSCDPTSVDPTRCVKVADGTGQYAEQPDCKCWVCDSAATDPTRCVPVPKYATTGTAHTQDGCNCVFAVGEVGPSCECKYDAAVASTIPADKRFHDVPTCTQDYKVKCGWKYSCASSGILQCADLGNQYYVLDTDMQTLHLLTDETAATYDADYKTNAVVTDCGYYNYIVGEPAQPKA